MTERLPPKPRTPESIAQFQRRHRVLLFRLNAALMKTTENAPQVLYHYTTAKAALNIVETSELWATHAWYVNDSTELTFGRDMFSSVIAKIASLGGHNARFREFLDSELNMKILMNYSSTFMCCFSEAENQLSQWRAYSGSGRTTGYALGFDPSKLGKLKFRNSSLLLMKVFYDQDEHNDIVQDILAIISVHLEQLDEQTVNEDWFELLSFLAQWIQIVLVGLKHRDFREEREWRLVYRTFGIAEPKGLDFRTSESGVVIPFCRIKARNRMLPLTKATVGPASEHGIATFSFEQALKKYKYDSVPVDHSGIPLRAL